MFHRWREGWKECSKKGTGKTWFYHYSGYQLEMAPWWWVGAYDTFPSSFCDPIRPEPVQIVFLLPSYMHRPAVGRHCFLAVIHPLCLLDLNPVPSSRGLTQNELSSRPIDFVSHIASFECFCLVGFVLLALCLNINYGFQFCVFTFLFMCVTCFCFFFKIPICVCLFVL